MPGRGYSGSPAFRSPSESQLADRAGYLRLAETVTSFLTRLRSSENVRHSRASTYRPRYRGRFPGKGGVKSGKM
jgi:hypothetical protein